MSSAHDRANHEAGHYAAAHALELIVEPLEPLALTIESMDRRGGGFICRGQVEASERYGVMLMSGIAAQTVGGNPGVSTQAERREKELLSSSAGDFKLFKEVFEELRGPERDLLMCHCLEQAFKLVREHMQLVDALRSELIARRTLFHEESFLICWATKHPLSGATQILEWYRDTRRSCEPPPDLEDDATRGLGWVEALQPLMLREGVTNEFIRMKLMSL